MWNKILFREIFPKLVKIESNDDDATCSSRKVSRLSISLVKHNGFNGPFFDFVFETMWAYVIDNNSKQQLTKISDEEWPSIDKMRCTKGWATRSEYNKWSHSNVPCWAIPCFSKLPREHHRRYFTRRVNGIDSHVLLRESWKRAICVIMCETRVYALWENYRIERLTPLDSVLYNESDLSVKMCNACNLEPTVDKAKSTEIDETLTKTTDLVRYTDSIKFIHELIKIGICRHVSVIVAYGRRAAAARLSPLIPFTRLSSPLTGWVSLSFSKVQQWTMQRRK